MTRPSPKPARQAVLLAALVVGLIGAGLLVVLVVGLLDGVRGTGPVVLGVLSAGVFALAVRLLLVSRSLQSRQSRPSTAVRAAPKPRPGSRVKNV